MIEFTGRISGAAEKAFWKNGRKIVLVGYLFVFPLVFPILLFFGYLFQSATFIYTFAVCLAIVPIFFFIPKRKKEKMALLPKRIYIKDEHIVCVADRYTESKFLSDVKKVIDHGEFYELQFPFGKVSEKYICQKALLTKGSLQEFETIFKKKIERKLDK